MRMREEKEKLSQQRTGEREKSGKQNILRKFKGSSPGIHAIFDYVVLGIDIC